MNRPHLVALLAKRREAPPPRELTEFDRFIQRESQRFNEKIIEVVMRRSPWLDLLCGAKTFPTNLS